MIATIAWLELKRLFLSPLAWAILAVVQVILGFMFLANLNYYFLMQSRMMAAGQTPGITEVIVAPLLANSAIVLLLATPLISMRLIAEERRNRTLPLLLSAPATMTQIVLGKYFGLLGFLWLIVAATALMPLSLLAGGTLDYGMFAAGLLGLLLLLAGFAAVGLFMSTLTQHQLIAAMATFGALLLFWILDWAGAGEGSGMLSYLSLLNHYEPLLRGVFDSSDVVYLLLFVVTFVVLSVRRLDMDRLGG
jgi:ABC-2 type transport system permease protein